MFEKKRESLYGKPQVKVDQLPKDANIFEREMFKEEHRSLSGNMSEKLSTSGNIFLDDFAAIGNYRKPRSYSEVEKTMVKLWSVDPITTLQETVYIRMITRNPKIVGSGEKLNVQRGQGLKAEFFMRLVWLAVNHPKTFAKNLAIFVTAGSWDDIFEILRLDLEYNGINHRMLDWEILIAFIVQGLADSDQTNLVKKYLPQIKPASKVKSLRSQANNFIAKEIVKAIYEPQDEEQKRRAYKNYRKLKASGNAHEWQQLISQGRYSELNFDRIAGRALAQLSKSKFLQNHDLEKVYEEWIMSKPVAKYTGFVYELFPETTGYGRVKPQLTKVQEETINKQFAGLIETAKQDMNRETSFMVVLDTSGSMTSQAAGLKVSALHVGKSMALYFSELLNGRFKNTFLEFNSIVKMHQWMGTTPVEKFYNFNLSYIGSTNFLGVAKLFVELKQKGYPEEEFPTGIICISDGDFNSTTKSNTNFQEFRNILRRGGFSEEFAGNYTIVLWDIPNSYYGTTIRSKFESLYDEGNFFYMSGFDPAGIAFLTGKTSVAEIPKNALQLFEAAMSQELLQMLTV